MVTKPVPIWERWIAKHKERAALLYYVLVVALNLCIILGVILFFVLSRKQ